MPTLTEPRTHLTIDASRSPRLEGTARAFPVFDGAGSGLVKQYTWPEFLKEGLELLPPLLADRYGELLAQHDVPAPATRDGSGALTESTEQLFRFGMDHELLLQVGVLNAGHRAILLTLCRRRLEPRFDAPHYVGADSAAPVGSPVPSIVFFDDVSKHRSMFPKIYRDHHDDSVRGDVGDDSSDEDPNEDGEGEDEVNSSEGTLPFVKERELPQRSSGRRSNNTNRSNATTVMYDTNNVYKFVFQSKGKANRRFTWVDLCGRDPKRVEFVQHLQKIATEYGFVEGLLLDVDLTLALPQIITCPNQPGQYLVILRAAAEETGIKEDSLHLLTSRWVIAVNTTRRTVVSIHRRDSKFLAELRRSFDVDLANTSMSVLLCKLLDEALISYVDAIHDSESLLDRYEELLLKDSDNQQPQSQRPNLFSSLWASIRGRAGDSGNVDSLRDSFFVEGKEPAIAPRLRNREYADQMMDSETFSRQTMNQLLYHLHRRCSVYNRMLILTKKTLEETYSTLHLASGDYAEQVGRSCSELAMKAESLHDNCQNLLNLHLSLVSFRTNELMNVLTVMSAVFVPITYISSVYGMNFDNMPELRWEYGYFYCLAGMACVVTATLLWFRSRSII